MRNYCGCGIRSEAAIEKAPIAKQESLALLKKNNNKKNTCISMYECMFVCLKCLLDVKCCKFSPSFYQVLFNVQIHTLTDLILTGVMFVNDARKRRCRGWSERVSSFASFAILCAVSFV